MLPISMTASQMVEMTPRYLTIDAGPHDRRYTPLSVPVDWSSGVGKLTCAAGERALPYHVSDGAVHFVLDRLGAGQRCDLVAEEGARLGGHWVKLNPSMLSGCVDIRVWGKPFTAYHHENVPYRPYFYPLRGPGGVYMTRTYPMGEDIADETSDHPHHRLLSAM